MQDEERLAELVDFKPRSLERSNRLGVLRRRFDRELAMPRKVLADPDDSKDRQDGDQGKRQSPAVDDPSKGAVGQGAQSLQLDPSSTRTDLHLGEHPPPEPHDHVRTLRHPEGELAALGDRCGIVGRTAAR